MTKTLTYTTSAVVSTTSSSSSATSTHGHSSGFFANTGAVAGVFTVVGLIGLAFLVLVILTIMRRRKAAQLDKEIAAAAANNDFNNAAFEDEYDHQGSSSHYPTSTGTHGAYGQAPIGQGGQWDPYNQASYDAGIAAAPGAYAMRDRRTSTGTGTSAGMAGFGARGAAAGAAAGYAPYSDGSTTQDPSSINHEASPYAAYAGGPRSAEHEGGGGYGGYNDPTQYAHPGPAHPGEYYDPYTNTAVPASPPAMPVPQHQPSYGHGANEDVYNDDAYGGVEEYDEPQHPGQPPFLQGAHRQDSSGTYRDDEDYPPRTLKVANE